MIMLNDLFYYQYPFAIPDLFNKKLTKDEFSVYFEMIKIFGAENEEIKKIIQVFRMHELKK